MGRGVHVAVTSYAVLAYAEVISPEFFNTIRARLFILYGTCMELVEEDLIVPRGCWVQNIILQWLDYAKVGQGMLR